MALENTWLAPAPLPEIPDQPRVVKALLLMVAAKHRPTYVHLGQVAFYSEVLAQRLGLDRFQQRLAYVAGLLHDIGKVAVSDEILTKPGRLTDAEAQVMAMHASWGADIAERSVRSPQLCDAIRYHHEWFNGKGYPARLSGNEVPLVSRMIAIADAFDTMTTHRPYRSAVSLDIALQELERCQGTQFDPALVPVFTDLVRDARTKGQAWALRRVLHPAAVLPEVEPLGSRLL